MISLSNIIVEECVVLRGHLRALNPDGDDLGKLPRVEAGEGEDGMTKPKLR